ncbi:hypothetical protein LS684_04285 [Cytobacillus spongiae]|uniref:hypothetical protein n=1 Tax=Cytobacillus spongiae TaxID=2901381 RepID=UPI001F2B4C8D|nr:hypothetical protein [Cytobacillus spongiae]UII56690.1 hypothetical protein LS684_04285 [Cytobacillus spongiae]
MTSLVGFNGPKPYAVIIWILNGNQHAKTICYSEAEETQAIKRLHTSGDLYNRFDQAIIVRDNEIICDQKESKIGA